MTPSTDHLQRRPRAGHDPARELARAREDEEQGVQGDGGPVQPAGGQAPSTALAAQASDWIGRAYAAGAKALLRMPAAHSVMAATRRRAAAHSGAG